jgi:hypothetical protein
MASFKGVGEVRDGLFRIRRTEILGWRIACGCGLACLVALAVSLAQLRSVERIFVLPGSGGVYAGPLERLDRSRAFFQETALLTTIAALQWSPNGLDLPEFLKLYFDSRAASQVEDLVKGRSDDLRARSLSSKPIVQSVSDPVPDGDARIVEVRGVLSLHGHFSGRAVHEEPGFSLSLRYVRNPDLGTATAYPWIVADFRAELPPPP